MARSLVAARQFISDGQLAAAGALIEDVLTTAPDNVDALALRAASLLAQGEDEHAFELLCLLAGRYPDRPDIAGHLGAAHRIAGRMDEARFCFERAVALDPENATHRAALTGALLITGDLAEARVQIDALIALGQRQDNPDAAAQGHGLAARLALLERAPLAAERAVRQALALRPGAAEDLALLSDILARLQIKDEALSVARQLYLQAPTDHDAELRLARRLMEGGDLDEAERHLRRIVATAPYHVDANHLLAMRLALKGEGARALAQFGALVRRAPDDPDMQVRMAMLLRVTGDLDKALTFSEIAMAQSASSARMVRDDLLLALGRVGEVWPDGAPAVAPEVLTVPLGTPATDVVLFARFAVRLAPADGRIACHAEADLLPLLAGMVGLAPTAAPAPPQATALTDLPAVLGLGAQELPTAPYLAVEAGRNRAWHAALQDFPRPLVGIAWDAAAPGLTLDALLGALGERPARTGTWVSLAFDDRRGQLAAHPAVVDAGAHFADVRDLVAAVAQLDFTVGADSLALHIAGALGCAGMVAVPAHLPSAWAHSEDRALWYPTLGVVRQRTPGGWAEALSMLHTAVQALTDPAEQRGDENEDGLPEGARSIDAGTAAGEAQRVVPQEEGI